MTPALPLDPESAPLRPKDLDRLAKIDRSLTIGLALQRWWEDLTGDSIDDLDPPGLERLLASNLHPYYFQSTPFSDIWPGDLGYGFIDQASIRGRLFPVLGSLQQIIFDRLGPLPGTPEGGPNESPQSRAHRLVSLQESLRAFVHDHFLRVAGFSTSYTPASKPERPVAQYLDWISWYPTPVRGLARGYLYSQLYYKRRISGKVGRFRKVDARQIDPRSLGPQGEFEWIVLQLDSSRATLEFAPLGREAPYWVLPFREEQLVIAHRNHYVASEAPDRAKRVESVYALGHSFLDERRGQSIGGPGFRLFRFIVKSDGVILGQQVVVYLQAPQITSRVLRLLSDSRAEGLGTRPWSPILNSLAQLSVWTERLGIDPLARLADAANLATGGQLETHLGFSRRKFEEIRLTHSAIRNMLRMEDVHSVWSAVSDWTRAEDLPEWARLAPHRSVDGMS